MDSPPSEPVDAIVGGHASVLLNETMEALRPNVGKLIVDGTAGAGGHSEAILEAGARLVAFDRDANALQRSQRRLARFQDRVQFAHASFADLPAALAAIGILHVDGILLDLGISSLQLDDAERGFSFQSDGPLDMRMDQASPMTASDLVNGASVTQLTQIFQRYGEEPAANRIAAAIARARATRPVRTTTELARIIESVVPRHGPRHPATRVFQAIRMAVNGEVGALQTALDSAPRLLNPGGRLAIITFHSLEDRAVKRFLRDTSSPLLDRPEWPAPRPNPRCFFHLPSRAGIQPSPAEVAANPRSRSARLRVAERLPTPPTE